MTEELKPAETEEDIDATLKAAAAEVEAAGAVDARPVEPAEPSATQQLAALKDKYLRLAADFENYKKRFHRELERMRRDDQQSMISDWLDILDTMDRALQMSKPDENPWYEGTLATQRKMLEVLKRRGIVPVDTEGTFDPKFHEAISAVPVPDQPDGTIIHTESRGYQRTDGTVVRPARVVVARTAH